MSRSIKILPIIQMWFISFLIEVNILYCLRFDYYLPWISSFCWSWIPTCVMWLLGYENVILGYVDIWCLHLRFISAFSSLNPCSFSSDVCVCVSSTLARLSVINVQNLLLTTKILSKLPRINLVSGNFFKWLELCSMWKWGRSH